MKKNFRILLFLFTLIPVSMYAQDDQSILRPLSFSALQDSMIKKPKPILIKIYTDWCVYCKMQDQQLKKSDSLKNIINKNFYFAELDAETTDSIYFNGKGYGYKAGGISAGINELAEILGKQNGQLTYPAIIILNSEYQILYRLQGLINNVQLIQLLHTIQYAN
jgi:thioredoxin-related protein